MGRHSSDGFDRIVHDGRPVRGEHMTGPLIRIDPDFSEEEEEPDPHRRYVSLIIMVVSLVITGLMLLGGSLFSSGSGDPVSNVSTPADLILPSPETSTVTETETVTVRVPGPVVTRQVPGPVQVRNVPTPVPGPTVTVSASPVRVPGPTVTKTIRTPGPTVTETVTCTRYVDC